LVPTKMVLRSDSELVHPGIGVTNMTSDVWKSKRLRLGNQQCRGRRSRLIETVGKMHPFVDISRFDGAMVSSTGLRRQRCILIRHMAKYLDTTL